MKRHNVLTSLLTLLVLPLIVACAGQTSESQTSEEQAEALVQGAARGAASASVSSDTSSWDSVGYSQQDLRSLSDAEILAAVKSHLLSILNGIQGLDSSGLDSSMANQLSQVAYRLEQKLNLLETDTNEQQRVIARVRNGQNAPFQGGYEGYSQWGNSNSSGQYGQQYGGYQYGQQYSYQYGQAYGSQYAQQYGSQYNGSYYQQGYNQYGVCNHLAQLLSGGTLPNGQAMSESFRSRLERKYQSVCQGYNNQSSATQNNYGYYY